MVHDRSVAIARELSAPIEDDDLEPVINLAFCGTPAAEDAVERHAPIVSPTNCRIRGQTSSADGRASESPLDLSPLNRAGGGIQRD
jgi:hypothetical protein